MLKAGAETQSGVRAYTSLMLWENYEKLMKTSKSMKIQLSALSTRTSTYKEVESRLSRRQSSGAFFGIHNQLEHRHCSLWMPKYGMLLLVQLMQFCHLSPSSLSPPSRPNSGVAFRSSPFKPETTWNENYHSGKSGVEKKEKNCKHFNCLCLARLLLLPLEIEGFILHDN